MTPTLLETMRAQPTGVPLWTGHRARLARSAAAWGIRVDLTRVERLLAASLRAVPEGDLRVRLTVAPDGSPAVEIAPVPAVTFSCVDLDPSPFLEAGGPLCIHKTTTREHYESRYRAALARGVDETVLVGADGRVVEGTRTSVWVRAKGGLLTPTLAAGGLPGVMRAHLLTRPGAKEVDLRVEDLLAADQVYVSNAVVGLVPVRLRR